MHTNDPITIKSIDGPTITATANGVGQTNALTIGAPHYYRTASGVIGKGIASNVASDLNPVSIYVVLSS